MIESVLYAGQPGTDRAEQFRSFLVAHFRRVEVTNVNDVGRLPLQGVDLVIIDGDPDSVHPPAELTAAAFPLPTMLIGGTGGKVSDSIGLKLGWDYGCLCLDHRAIVDDVAVEHPIFQGPVEVPAPVIEHVPATENFRHYVHTKDVPEKVPVVDIHAGPSMDDAQRAELEAKMMALFAAGDHDGFRAMRAELPRPGLVSTSAGFLDSPDCEFILGGINMKAHDYVAVGRQGRFLAWGFHDDPSRMTDLGKALFLNALHYISQYADAPVEALRVSQSREVLYTMFNFLDMPEAGDPAQLLAREFGEALPSGIGSSAAEAVAWWSNNRRFIRRVGGQYAGHYEVDVDLVALGFGNDEPELLAALAPSLGLEGEEGDRARRLWQRYVRRDPSDAAREQAWLAEHHDYLFFSDWAGYRWIARDDLPVLTIPRSGVCHEGPVTLSASAHREGERLEATVSFYLQPGYYLYAPGATDGVPITLVPTSLHELVAPPAFPTSDDFHLSGQPRVQLQLHGDSDEIELDVTVQACNEQSCMPPSTVRVRAVAAG